MSCSGRHLADSVHVSLSVVLEVVYVCEGVYFGEPVARNKNFGCVGSVVVVVVCCSSAFAAWCWLTF